MAVQERTKIQVRDPGGPEPGRTRGRLQPLRMVAHNRGTNDPPDIVWTWACADGTIAGTRTWGYATRWNRTGRLVMGMLGLKELPAGKALDVTDLVGEEYELQIELVEGETRTFTRVTSATRIHHPDPKPKGPPVESQRPRPKGDGLPEGWRHRTVEYVRGRNSPITEAPLSEVAMMAAGGDPAQIHVRCPWQGRNAAWHCWTQFPELARQWAEADAKGGVPCSS